MSNHEAIEALDTQDELRSLAVLLAASLEMNDQDDSERSIANELVDIALVRVRKLSALLERLEVRHA